MLNHLAEEQAMKQRDAIKMTREEAEASFAKGKVRTRPGSSPPMALVGIRISVSMGWVYQGGRIFFQTYGESQKIRYLRRDPKAAVILEAVWSGGFEHRKLRGLLIRGIF